MQKLVAQKLEGSAEEVRAEGWGWIEMRVERDYLELNRYGRLRPVQRPYTGDEQQQMDALTAQQDELAEKLEALSEDDEDAYEEADRLNEEIGRVNAALIALESVALVWDESQIAEAGAFVIVGPQGELVIERGLVRRENASALEAAGADVSGTPEARAHDPVSAQAPKVRPVHSAKLCQRLTAHRTAAIHAELVEQPSVALAAVLACLVPRALPEHYGHTSARGFLALSGENNHDSLLRAADDLSASPAWDAIEAQRARWIVELPAKRADLLPWLIEQDPGTTLLDLLAFCTGSLLDGIAGEEKPHAINALAGALNLDMTRYWTPTRARYFDHVSKTRIAEVVAAAVSPKAAADLEKMKKADAAAAAGLRLAKVAWVPEIFTDRDIPASPTWSSRDDDEEEDDDSADGDNVEPADGTGAPDDDEVNANAEPDRGDDTGDGAEHVNDTPPDAGTAPATTARPPWPFPTADSVGTGSTAQSGPLAA